MRVVLDTNTVVSGLLWQGASSVLLRTARERRIELLTSAPLLAELADVLPRAHFTRKLAAAGLSVAQWVSRYALLARQVIPADIYAHIKKASLTRCKTKPCCCVGKNWNRCHVKNNAFCL